MREPRQDSSTAVATPDASAPVVGVLALQGDFAEHTAALEAAGVRVREVRQPQDVEGLDGLVLPGGESSAMLRLLDVGGLFAPLDRELRSGVPVLGTCAGLILLAKDVAGPHQRSFGVLDVTVQRNGYGRQLHSGTFDISGPGVPADSEGIFIRAPRITRSGAGVEVLARRGEDPVLVRQGPVLGACFHPELQQDHPVIAEFVARVRERAAARARAHSS